MQHPDPGQRAFPKGDRLGPYEIAAPIGAGGMGEVFRARDTRLNRDVAVKVLPKDFAADADRLRRFEQESRTLAALNHPNVLTIHDAGVHEGAPYLVSELLEGRTLREELAGGALSTRKATDYALQMAQGLAAAHGRGVVHRDLKPDNVFVTKDGRVKILDFGLAKLREVQSPKSEVRSSADPDAPTVVQPAAETTEPGRVMGTPAYMSPEQVRGEAVDHRADIFAFGCVLYEMVSGKRPFKRDTSFDTMAAIVSDEPPELSTLKPDLPLALTRIVHRCLEKSAERRFQSATDLAFALESLTGTSAPPMAGTARTEPPPARRFGPGTVITLAVMAFVLLVVWHDRQSEKTISPSASSQPAAAGPPTNSPVAPVETSRSIAVLPFVNLSADKADEYLSDGMTEELLNVLAQVPGLRVPGRSSSFAFKGKTEDNIFRKVGEQLHVATVLEGSVRKAGDKLRITAQLINVADGFHLWSTNYDREMKDILAVQTEVAQQVAQVLRVKLGVEATRALAKTQNPEAHRLYLLGRYHFGKATQAGWSEAIQAFNQAIQLDPSYALAYCGLADNYNFLGGVLMPGKEAWAKEKDAAQRAVTLDPNLADAHLSLALALAGEYDWSGVDREIRRALELNPNLALARDQNAWVLSIHGRFDEAAVQSKMAVELDPLSPLMHVNRGYWFYLARRFDDANTHLRKGLDLDPNYPWALRTLGWSLLWQGDKAGALPLMERAQALDADPFSIGSFGYALAVSGDRAKAEQILRDLEKLAKQHYVTPAASMVVYLGLGEKEKALEWLEKSYADRDPNCWALKVSPMFDPLRTEPRFQALLKKAGLDP